jgi:hypothetical protein
MAELFLGYATFAHYTKENGYKLSKQGNSFLSLWLDGGKMVSFPVYDDKKKGACGAIYMNDEDLNEIFSGKTDFIKILIDKCIRKDWMTGLKNKHCPLPREFWGILETEISCGTKIKCIRGTARH